MAHTPVLWNHTTLPTTFNLAVEDLCIKFFAADDATHLLDMLRKKYSITVNPSGSKYCGLIINWNYRSNYVNIYMPNTVRKALVHFQHPTPTRPQHSSHKWLAPTYESKVQ